MRKRSRRSAMSAFTRWFRVLFVPRTPRSLRGHGELG
jgi:hypothetical protein